MGLNRWLLASLLVAMALQASSARAEIQHKTTRVAGTTVEYEVVLPNDYDPAKAYPAVLAFGPGPQTTDIDRRIIADTFRDQAERRGYLVVMPAAPGGQLFFQGGEQIIPAFLRQILTAYKVEGGKFRAAGLSNGGTSAFQVASLYPQYFISITAFPGFMWSLTAEHIAAISKLCVHMFVGANDELGFDEPMRQDAAAFRARGIALTYTVEPGQGHHIDTLSGPGAARLFDQFEQDRRGCLGAT